MIVNFDYEKLARIRMNFRVAFGIGVGIYDIFGRIISQKHTIVRSSLCAHLRQSSDAFDIACSDCDKAACLQCQKLGKPFLYQCHIGLSEYITPLYCQNILVGFIIAGQMLPCGDFPQAVDDILHNLQPYCVDESVVRELISLQPEMTQRKLQAACELLQDSAASLWLSKGVTVKEDSVVYKIDSFIRDNIQDELTITSICETFQISKTRLSKLAQNHFGTSLGKYIVGVRVEESRRLLRDTNCSIGNIALRVGIPDYNYFSKVFKAAEGVSPKEYRKRFEHIQGQAERISERADVQ